MQPHHLFNSSPSLGLLELGLKNQLLISRLLDHGLTEPARLLRRLDDGVAMALKAQARLSEEEQRAQGYRQYIWHTQGDENVRPSHAANAGKVFSWDNPPPTGHPGEEYGCRCWAEPLPDDPPIEPVYPLETLIGALLLNPAARAVYNEILRRIGRPGPGVEEVEPEPETNTPDNDQVTQHGMERADQRNITQEQINEAIRTAEEKGNVTTQTGKYGTPKKVYKGSNGVTVVVETSGRNAGKIITVWRQ